MQLLVGLANPGDKYANTRHNAGAWFIERICDDLQLQLRLENKLKGQLADFKLNNHPSRVLIPTTYMNHSGEAVQAISQYYKLEPQSILIAHDDLDLPAGTVRFKTGGGHGGHNGLRSIIAHLNTADFHRLRIGIGHPGNAKDVVDYVLNRPSLTDRQLIDRAIEDALLVLPDIVAGNLQKAMQRLHTSPTP